MGMHTGSMSHWVDSFMGTHTGSHWVEGINITWGCTLGLRIALWGYTLDQHHIGLRQVDNSSTMTREASRSNLEELGIAYNSICILITTGEIINGDGH